MSSDWRESRGLRFDPAHLRLGPGPSFRKGNSQTKATNDVVLPLDETLTVPSTDRARLSNAISRTRDYLCSIQHEDGFWCGELEGDSILESEYILLLTHLGRGQSAPSLRAAKYIRQQQLADGGWAIYRDGPLE